MNRRAMTRMSQRSRNSAPAMLRRWGKVAPATPRRRDTAALQRLRSRGGQALPAFKSLMKAVKELKKRP